jgi:hypothetical protein
MHRAKPRATGFPLAGFKHFLTLFSKFFASFPHGTCSLSVMRQYLALEGIYLPLQAAIPSNPTLQERIVRPRTATPQDSHLLRYRVPADFSDGRGRWRLSRLQFGRPRGPPDWRRELRPLHSPLLRASRLFSSPPLSDMLKFRGWPGLTPWRTRIERKGATQDYSCADPTAPRTHRRPREHDASGTTLAPDSRYLPSGRARRRQHFGRGDARARAGTSVNCSRRRD